ncbi:MAG: hypothetical protein WBX15_02065 [Thermoanaerobaculia bacterium]
MVASMRNFESQFDDQWLAAVGATPLEERFVWYARDVDALAISFDPCR